MTKIQEIAAAIDEGKSKIIGGLVQEAIDSGLNPSDILNDGMIGAMTIVGEKFTNHVYFVPEMLRSARTMKMGVAVLKPYLIGNNKSTLGKMVMGTVAGDLHDIGKNLVVMMIESVGIEVIDLGVDVPIATFIEAVQDPDVALVGISTLLTTTMPALEDTVAALNQCENRQQFKVMVGGAPVTKDYADEIGADAFTLDAVSAADMAKLLVS